jgi:hypothetical protein
MDSNCIASYLQGSGHSVNGPIEGIFSNRKRVEFLQISNRRDKTAEAEGQLLEILMHPHKYLELRPIPIPHTVSTCRTFSRTIRKCVPVVCRVLVCFLAEAG